MPPAVCACMACIEIIAKSMVSILIFTFVSSPFVCCPSLGVEHDERRPEEGVGVSGSQIRHCLCECVVF